MSDGANGNCGSAQIACALYDDKPEQQRIAVVSQKRDAAGRWQFTGTDCVVAGPAQVTADMVREQAIRLVPTATVGLAPHGTSLVNIETVMWADAPTTQTLPPVTILGRSVTIALRLDHVAWDFGDGTTDDASSAGKAYDATGDPCRSKQCADYYGHTYRRTGTVRVGATASWTASFTVDGGAGVAIPGTVDGPRSEAPLVVKQARAVLVPNPGEH